MEGKIFNKKITMKDSRKIKIIADDKIPFLRGVLEPFADIEYYPGREINNDKCINADALIIRTRTECNEEMLNGTNVKLITTATIGYDHIDTEYCKRNNIKWLNAPGCNSSSVQQYIASALLHLARKNQIDLSSKTIGIVGVGNVGKNVKKIAEILEMNVLLNDPPREREEVSETFVSIEKIKSEADIITFHVPLNKDGIDKTYHFANDAFFNELPKKPIILNSSRGEVIQTDSVKKAINSNKISGLVLDVWENEPDIDLELLKMADISTSHIAGYSVEGKANGTSVCVNAVGKYFDLNISPNWFPPELPHANTGNKFNFDCSNKNYQEILTDLILRTYNICEDNNNLKKRPELFEQLRGDYPIRREFTDYLISIRNCDMNVGENLTKLGFNLILEK